MRKAIFPVLLLSFVCITAASRQPIIEKECLEGVSFWCETLMNAKKCNAVDFCIQSVWENHYVRADSTPLCDDCKDWVSQARSLIENKNTADEIINTLEWSCSLCPVESARAQCKEIISRNVHEILKLLESKMDPDAICSAIHFCNNRIFTEMFEKAFELKLQNHAEQKLMPFTCTQCTHVGLLVEKKLANFNHDEMLEGMLKICGKMSSFSDSCSSIVFKNFNEIYAQLPNLVTKEKLCRATCTSKHQKLESTINTFPEFDNPDIPCELCQQLLLHLREVFIINTTAIEFKNILEGFCSQIPKITDDCISLAENYYDVIYNYLENGLNANKTCALIGICKKMNIDAEFPTPTMPLLSNELFPMPAEDDIKVDITTQDKSINLYSNGKMCTACEYTMNLIHVQLNKNGIEDDILQKVKLECKKLPAYVRQCEDLIDMFGDQIMSAIYQGTNPRLVCPLIKMCPPNLTFEYLQETAVNEKPTCPFCLFAMQEIHDMVASNVTKSNVEKVLDQLCAHLSSKLKSQCVAFVEEYSSEVVDMILADFSPQDACVFIKLCSQEEPKLKRINMVGLSGESSYLDNNDDSHVFNNPQCELCKAVIKLIEQRVIDIKSKDEIRRELENSCDRLRKFSKECRKFVDKYSDRIVDLVSKELAPEEVCRELIFCVSLNNLDSQDYDMGFDIVAKSFDESLDEEEISPSTTSCILCEFVMTKIEEELNDTQRSDDIKHVVKNICSKMPSSISKQCNQFIDYYFDMIIVLIETTKPTEICQELKLCPKYSDALETQLVEIQKDIYTCALCRGVVESLDTIIEDPQVDIKLEGLEEKICEKFAGKFKEKCHNLASTYGVAIINLMKNLTESDQICFKLELCPMSDNDNTGMIDFN